MQQSDLITIGSNELSRLSKREAENFQFFIRNANDILGKINQQIIKFNEEDQAKNKKQILKQIYGLYTEINNQTPDTYIALSEDFRNKIHSELFTSIKENFASLGVTSLQEKSLQSKLDSTAAATPTNPAELSEIMANMSSKKADQMVAILAKGNAFRIDEFKNLFQPEEAGYTEFQQFLNDHSISYLGGVNSKNFKITNLTTNEEFVLKVENRGGVPKTAEAHLKERSLKEVVPPIFVERIATYKNDQGEIGSRTLLITEFCPYGDLTNYAKKQPNDSARIASAVNVFTQIGNILEGIRINGCGFPDQKNGNWLIDSNEKLRLADTKSFAFIDKNGDFNYNNEEENRGYSFISTPYIKPPEFKVPPYKGSADKAHSYILGKNIYQYLTCCDYKSFYNGWAVKTDASQLDFNHAVFQTEEGKYFKSLIEKTVKNDPKDRISVAEVVQELAAYSIKFTADDKMDDSTTQTHRNFKDRFSEIKEDNEANESDSDQKFGKF